MFARAFVTPKLFCVRFKYALAVPSRACVLSAALTASVLLTACGEPASSTKPGVKLKAQAVHKFDPSAPFPELSAGVFDGLSIDVPELAKYRDATLAAERSAIKGALDDTRAKAKGGATTKKVGAALPDAARFTMRAALPVTTTASNDALARLIGRLNVIPAALAADAGYSGLLQGVQEFGTGHQVASLLGGGTANVDSSAGGGSKTVTVPGEKSGTVAATYTVSAEAGKAASAVLETRLAIPDLLLDANSKVAITGSICPDADGKVEFTIKAGSNGRAGSAGSAVYDRNIEARVTATVGDDAEVIDAEFDMKQATRSTTGGRQVYVETGQSARISGNTYSTPKVGDIKTVRASSQATAADVELSDAELTRAYYLAEGALEGAKEFWKSGNCIKIDATSPGSVAPRATSKIPVAVKHVKDGSSVPAKVTVQLSGGASVDPSVIPKAPGDVTHVAADKRGEKMIVTLTATSRRGKDVRELTLSNGQAFSIQGGADDFRGSGTICDIAQPFTVEGSGVVVKFTPASDRGGTYDYTGNMSGFAVFGTGTYTVKYAGDTPASITATGPGSVKTPMGVKTRNGTEQYTLSSATGPGCK